MTRSVRPPKKLGGAFDGVFVDRVRDRPRRCADQLDRALARQVSQWAFQPDRAAAARQQAAKGC